jgi:L-lactate dehydrogenase
VITAGVRQRPKETRLDLLQRNKSVVKDIVTQVVKHSPNSILLIVTNPVDVMTYLAWKTSGFSPSRVFGTGTSLDTCRFRNMLAQELGGLNPADIHADIIGEHGDKQIPVWSTANINGMCLRDLANGMDLKEEQLGNAVRNAAYEVISLKGYTNWGIGFVVCSIVQAVLNDRRSIWNVSVMTPAVYSSSPAVHPKTKETQENVFLSLPCVLGSRGVHSVLQLSLDSSENKAFQSLRAQMLAIQSKL